MLPASYNEPMAFGFNSVTSFVSDPDEKTITFMDRSGYKSHSETITVTTSENLACDSLLGVKYVLVPSGDANTAGLTKTTGIDNFKDVYQNPNAFPAAFVYEGTGDFDSNGVTDVVDAQLALKEYVESIAGKTTTANAMQKAVCDIDGDGKLSVVDVQYILMFYTQKVAGKTPQWPDGAPDQRFAGK